MHIAFVTPEAPYGDEPGCGVAAYLRAIIPPIVDAGHRVTVVAGARKEESFQREDSLISVHHVRFPSLHWYTAKVPLVRDFATLPLRQVEWSRTFFRKLASIAANRRIDVVESTEAGALCLHRIAPLVIRLHGSERIFREHSGRRLNASVRSNDALEALACKRAAAITAPSRFHASQVAKRRGWPIERVRVIPNPISESLMKDASRFQRSGHNERLVFYAGRLAPVKGIETLLAAAKLVRANDSSINFVLAGPWQMPQPPQAYGLDDHSMRGIDWIGPQRPEQVIDWYKRASLVVAPSQYESFGITAIEATAYGLPIIATDAGAFSEVLGGAGLVSKNDPKALAQAITTAFSQNGLAADESKRRHVFETYAPAQIARQTIGLYESLAV